MCPADGAGLFLAVLSNYFTGEIIISNTMFRNNSADQGAFKRPPPRQHHLLSTIIMTLLRLNAAGGGGGLFLQYQPAIFGDGSIVIENSIFENNVAQGKIARHTPIPVWYIVQRRRSCVWCL